MPQANVVIVTNHSWSTVKNRTVFCYCIGQKNLKNTFEPQKLLIQQNIFIKSSRKGNKLWNAFFLKLGNGRGDCSENNNQRALLFRLNESI